MWALKAQPSISLEWQFSWNGTYDFLIFYMVEFFLQVNIVKASPSFTIVCLKAQMPSGESISPSMQAWASCSLLPFATDNNCDSCPKLLTWMWGTERNSRGHPSLSTSSDLAVVSLQNGGGEKKAEVTFMPEDIMKIFLHSTPSLQELELTLTERSWFLPLDSPAPWQLESSQQPMWAPVLLETSSPQFLEFTPNSISHGFQVCFSKNLLFSVVFW